MLGNDLLSRRVAPTVPSALEGLTSVFGKGTGVSPPPWSPNPGIIPSSGWPLRPFGPPPQNGEEFPYVPGSSAPGGQAFDLAPLGHADGVRAAAPPAPASRRLPLAAEVPPARLAP